jgi:hypothetical protein
MLFLNDQKQQSLLFNIVLGVLASAIRREREIEGLDKKGRKKTTPIYRSHDGLHIKSQEICQKKKPKKQNSRNYK